MATRTDKLMYLDTEFYDANYFGFVNFYNSEGTPGGTVGLGKVSERRIGFYGSEYTDIFEIKNFNDIQVHNYKEENEEISEYYPAALTILAKDFSINVKNSKTISIDFEKELNYIKIEENID